MSHRERVQTALAHEEPDRVPLEMSFTPEFAPPEHLGVRGHLLDEAGGRHNPHGGGNDYALERALDLDVLLTSVGWANSYYAGEIYNPGADHYTDEWGIGWKNVPTRRASATASTPSSATRRWRMTRRSTPTGRPTRPGRNSTPRSSRRCGTSATSTGSSAHARRRSGKRRSPCAVSRRILMDLICEPELVARILDIPQHYHPRSAGGWSGSGVDMIWLGDDLGAQHAMIMAPEQWRRILKPRFAALIAELKGINPALKIAYHTDGYVAPVIGDLIEIGVDVLNPVQPASMDPAELKRKFGEHLCFMGTMDVQDTLPFGSVDDVRREVEERVATVGKGGGLILAPTHHVQLDTPIENFMALVDTISETSVLSTGRARLAERDGPLSAPVSPPRGRS